MKSVSNSKGPHRKGTPERIARIKEGLVLQLFTQQGEFWDLVRDLRTKRGIEPVTGWPPVRIDGLTVLFPENTPKWWDTGLSSGVINMRNPGKHKEIEEHNQEVHKFNQAWYEDLYQVTKHAVPKEYRSSHRRIGSFLENFGPWIPFVSACVLYDPPDTDLPGFAGYGGEFEELLIEYHAGADEEVSFTLSSTWRVLEEINSRHLKPRGLDLNEMWRNVTTNWPEIEAENYDRGSQLKRRYYIKVDEYTTKEDVETARRVINDAQGKNSGGKPSLRPLVAMQCAILYDDYNGTDPEDNRLWLWTYKKLANEFKDLGVKNKRSAEEHVKLGRKLRPKNKTP